MARARPPAWSTVSGPWEQGNYADLAVGDDGAVHTIWVDAEGALFYSVGPTWGPAERIVSAVQTGDGGRIRPELVLDGAGLPVVAYASGGRAWWASRDPSGVWVQERVEPGSVTPPAGTGERLGLGVHEGAPTLAWLDTRADPGGQPTQLWLAVRGRSPALLTEERSGRILVGRPVIRSSPDGPVVGVQRCGPPSGVELRIVPGPVGRVGLSVMEMPTEACWPGGMALVADTVYTSERRAERRRIMMVDAAGARELPARRAEADAVEPRVSADGQVVLWVEVSPGLAELVIFEGGAPMKVVGTSGRLELGDPVVVGSELWVPYQGATAVVLRQVGP